jgi:hypothetical protein
LTPATAGLNPAGCGQPSVEQLGLEPVDAGELRGDPLRFFLGQGREECLNLLAANVQGMALVVEQDEAPDPVDVGLLGPDRVVLEADRFAHLLREPLLPGFLGKLAQKTS